ncbi:MAG: MFS transporter [Methanothrix sp.]|nr:MAG: MFS transporter [Methanothrix sp.]
MFKIPSNLGQRSKTVMGIDPTKKTVYTLSLLSFVTWFTYTSITPTLAVNMLDDNSPTWLLGVLVTIAGLTGTMIGAPLGIVGDRTSLGKLISIGMILRIIPFGILAASAITPFVSIATVAIFGLLNPFVIMLGYLWISRNSDARGADIGTFSAAPWAAAIFGPLFGMYVISNFGFKWLCIIGAVLSLLLFPLSLRIADRVPKKVHIVSIFKEHRTFVAFYIIIAILVDATVFFYAPYWMYIGHNLGADESMIRMGSSFVSLMVAISTKLSGNLCDSIGRYKVTYAGYGFMAIMVLLMPFAWSFAMLVGLYSLAKFSECFAETGISVLLSDAPDEMRGSLSAATGWISAGSGVTFAALSGMMIDRYGVLPSYIVSASLIAVMILTFAVARPRIAKSLVKAR